MINEGGAEHMSEDVLISLSLRSGFLSAEQTLLLGSREASAH